MGQGKERGPEVKFPVLNLFGTGYRGLGTGRGPREVRVKRWDPQGGGWG